MLCCFFDGGTAGFNCWRFMTAIQGLQYRIRMSPMILRGSGYVMLIGMRFTNPINAWLG
jgi:hypothetical protein